MSLARFHSGAAPSLSVTKSATDSPRRNIVVDAGPLVAAINRDDVHHAWAVNAFQRLPGRFLTCEAAITEAQHGLENDLKALKALRRLVARMELIPIAPFQLDRVFDEVESWAPQMDFADACAVVLARHLEPAFVLTTDFRDFSIYRVPFVSPEGAFHP